MHLQLMTDLFCQLLKTGLILMMGAMPMLLLSPISGKLIGKLSPHILVLSGMLLSTIATLIYSNLTLTTALIVINISQIIGGIETLDILISKYSLIIGSVGKTKLSFSKWTAGILSRNLGMALCMAVVTLIISLLIKVDLENATKQSLTIP